MSVGIDKWWPALGAPVMAFLVGVYHRFVVAPPFRAMEQRITNLEGKSDGYIADISELKADIRWIRAFLANGGKTKK